MNSKLLLTSSLCFLLMGWSGPAFSNAMTMPATTDTDGTQRVAPATNTDQTITSLVKDALMHDIRFAKDFSAFTVSTKDGVVTVSGKVADAVEKAAVAQVISTIPGVKSVDNKLEVAK